MTTRETALQSFQDAHDPTAELLRKGTGSLPRRWVDYVSDDGQTRIRAAEAELEFLGRYLPKLAEVLNKITVDATLLRSSVHGIVRAYIVQLDSELFVDWSRAPRAKFDTPGSEAWTLIEENGPEVLRWIYQNLMDGLTDLYGFGGFKTASELRTLEEEQEVYAEKPWFADFASQNDTSKIVELFSSGGGGYILLDLSQDQTAEANPAGLYVDLNTSDPPQTVHLFAYLDTWSSIALGE